MDCCLLSELLDCDRIRRRCDAAFDMQGPRKQASIRSGEFAYWTTSAVSYFGPFHNPWALDHVFGESSGGSAAAIATALCFGTLGTDTGGSICITSSHCGVVGLMPNMAA
jgi:hypothetical protein